MKLAAWPMRRCVWCGGVLLYCAPLETTRPDGAVRMFQVCAHCDQLDEGGPCAGPQTPVTPHELESLVIEPLLPAVPDTPEQFTDPETFL